MTESEDQKAQDESTTESNPEAAAQGATTAEPDVEQRLSALQKERDDARDRMLRVAADFENWKKRARKDMSDAEWKAKESVLRDIVEVIDNLERAVASAANATDPKPVLEGVNLVLRLFQQKLERHDVKAIEAKGQAFDPHVHEAVSRITSADVPAGQIVDELAKGYRMGDRLLRPAIVVVAVAPPASETEPAGEKAGEG